MVAFQRMVTVLRSIHTDAAPAANGHYSQAIVHAGTVYVSGQLGRRPGMSDSEAGDITVQVRRSLASLRAILVAAGSDLDRVVKVTVFIADIALWPAVDAVYRDVFGAHRPARAVVPTALLHFGALVEIDAIAALR